MRNKKIKSQTPRGGRKNTNALLGNYIIPTEHAIKRYQERIRMIHTEKAYNAIIEGVKRSRLIALTKYGGREIRENKGTVFVCELQGNHLYVITILLSQVALRFVV